MKFYRISSIIESNVYYEVDFDPNDFYCIYEDCFGNETSILYKDKIGIEFFETKEELFEYRKNRLNEVIETFKKRIVDFEEALNETMICK